MNHKKQVEARKMIVVYIASPYTIGDQAVNVKRQIDTADELMNLYYCPIVPLLTHFQHMHHPRPYEDWLAIDFEHIKRCDILLRLPGESNGADREVEFAKSIGKQVVYSITELENIKGVRIDQDSE
jgi:hypothetical protein